MSSKKSDPIVEFAYKEIEDPRTRDQFLGLMAISLIGGDVKNLARQYGINDDHPVWSLIQKYNSLPKPDPIAEFAIKEIPDQTTRDIFVEMITATLLNRGVERTISKLDVGNDHPVWPYIWKFLRENISL